MKMRQKRTIGIIGFSFLLSLVISIIGVYISPRGFAFDERSFTVASVIGGGGLLLAIPFLFALMVMFLRSKQKSTGYASILLQSVILFVIVAATIVVFGLINGLLTILIQSIFASMKMATIKLVISIVAEALSVLTAPIIIAVMLGYAYQNGSALEGIKAGLKGLKHTYLKLLAITVISTLLGYGIAWLFRPGSVFLGMADILKTIVFALLGTIGLYFAIKICVPKKEETDTEKVST